MRWFASFVCVMTLLSAMACLAEPREEGSSSEPLCYKRPADFTPFHYKLTTEQLRDRFSEDMMRRAEEEWKEIESVNKRGPWKPTYESLVKHETPEWYKDAKFGIAINMGLHSVPAWDKQRKHSMYPDAYGGWMYHRTAEHHAKVWGKDFHFDDFFPMYTAANFDGEKYAELIEEVGAKYILPMCKHHDGVAWWNTAWSHRSHARMGPKRDLLTPLINGVRKRGIKFFLYCPVEEYAYPILKEDGSILLRDYDWRPVMLEPFTDRLRRRVSGYIPVRSYYDHYMTPLIKEMMDHFEPDGMWLDGDFIPTDKEIHSRELMAYFYNKNHGRKDVCMNDRLGKGSRTGELGDFNTSEFKPAKLRKRYWEEIRGIGKSYAFHHEDTDETLVSPTELVHLFVDIVASNGNLLLIIGPDRTGTLPDIQMRRLKALGRWLQVNGEAIYGTRVLPPHKKDDIRFTQSKDGRFAYAICTRWPGKSLELQGPRAKSGAKIQMLGVEGSLDWSQDEKGLVISIPESLQNSANRPCRHAWAIRIPK